MIFTLFFSGNPQFGMLGPSTLLLFVSLSLTFLAFYVSKSAFLIGDNYRNDGKSSELFHDYFIYCNYIKFIYV